LRILLLANVVPYPPHGGIQLRILRLMEHISRHHEVTLCCHAWSEADEANARELTRSGIRTFTGRLGPEIGWDKLRSAFAVILQGRPPELALYRSRQLVGILRRLLRSEAFDAIQVEETLLTHYVSLLPTGSSTRRIVVLHNIASVQAARTARIETTLLKRVWRHFNSFCMHWYEPRLLRAFDRVITVSEEDRQRLLSIGRREADIPVVPNGVDTDNLRPLQADPGPPTLLLVGNMSYGPCEDAAIWLVREILPLLKPHWPDLQVWIVGRDPGLRVRALAGNGVHVTGRVDDLLPFYQRATIAVAPLRAGSGSRLKILEAMALGRPVVSTTIGAEGLDIEPDVHFLAADRIDSFADSIGRLLQNPAMACSIASAARTRVMERYDWKGIAQILLRTYETLPGQVHA
jgi:glycosyltransferase involved in cell wall biosynthesis